MGTSRVVSGRERGQSPGEVETGLTAICCHGCAERMPGSSLTVLVVLMCFRTLGEVVDIHGGERGWKGI